MASAGRILIMPKGTYEESATYEMLDMVHYNGTSWLAKKTVVGIEPSEDNNEYWHNLIDITPETIGALSKSGGTLNGNVKIENQWAALSLTDSTGRRAMMEKNPSTNTCSLYSYLDKDNHNCLAIAPETEDIKNSITLRNVVDGTVKTYKAYGEHNKKYGSYLGNGSSAERGVKTGSVGSFMMIWSNQGMGFVSPVGGIFASGTGEVRYIDSYSCHYGSDGQLTLRSDLMLVNKNGVTYNYQCL